MRPGYKRDFARALRRDATDAERRLWRLLRQRRLLGLRFRRQHPLGPYIVDFVCLERRLVVELDGGQHVEAAGRDARRDAWLRSQGFRVMRVWNDDALTRPDDVLEAVLLAVSDRDAADGAGAEAV
jgi:very-short-patch-repair endonuclease